MNTLVIKERLCQIWLDGRGEHSGSRLAIVMPFLQGFTFGIRPTVGPKEDKSPHFSSLKFLAMDYQRVLCLASVYHCKNQVRHPSRTLRHLLLKFTNLIKIFTVLCNNPEAK